MVRSSAWARWFYSAALYLLSPLLWRRVWREHALTHSRWQRLGFGPTTRGEAPVTWLHCASVGEVLAARPLIEALLEHYPDRRLVVTTMTATGAERVQALIEARRTHEQPGTLEHAFVPLDFPGAARRFVRRLHPRLALFFETELWPNLLHACRRHEVPAVVVNGRLSPRAFVGYRRIRPLLHDALANVAWLAAKSRDDAERFAALGMTPHRTTVVGSLKYDLTPDPAIHERSEHLRTVLGGRPVWVAGSTHPGEDEQILVAHIRLRETLPEALLILVPRHPQRFEAVAELCRQHDLPTARRSRREVPCADSAVYLGDTMGELLDFYATAAIAFVGGSLVPVGGHNLLEPAALGTPVISGPQLANFSDVAKSLREAGALIEVEDSAALARELARLFDDRAARERLAGAGLAVVEANQGALIRTLDGLATYLETK